MTITDSLRERAQAWLAEDPDAETRNELQGWLSAVDSGEIEDAFAGTLEFGTAGLRGLLGPGPNRMNRVVVARATAGLCTHLLATVPNAKARGVVIGYDGRKNSDVFARDAAAIVAGFGLRVLLWDRRVPTPYVAFAVKHHEAAAGIQVTASHNPPRYNGYKVYWENGAQIISPTDAAIAAEIERVGAYASIPRASFEGGAHVSLGADTEAAYFTGVRTLLRHPQTPRDTITIAYTALHGVGNRSVMQGLREHGFSRVHSVAEQAEPDGNFPTVAFPNPEEKGAMDLLLALGEKVRADLLLANDPDADRLAVAARGKDGRVVTLTGNEIGQLFAHYLLTQDPQPNDRRLVTCSVVSSPMLGAIAAHHKAEWEQTLTGFKWIANRSLERAQKEGLRIVFGYEEALGYCVGTLVRDKDGVSAALVMAEIAAWCKSRGVTILDELETAFRTYGLFLSKQISVTLPGADGLAKIGRIMQSVRGNLPTSFGDARVEQIADYGDGVVITNGSRTPLNTPATNLILFTLQGGHRVMLRPSGTEPKIKYYFDYRVTLGQSESLDAGKARGEAELAGIVDGFKKIVDAIA